MDDLVAVGTAGIIGLGILALVVAGGVFWIADMAWNAVTTGEWQDMSRIVFILVVFAGIYLGTGLWFRQAGRI